MTTKFKCGKLFVEFVVTKMMKIFNRWISNIQMGIIVKGNSVEGNGIVPIIMTSRYSQTHQKFQDIPWMYLQAQKKSPGQNKSTKWELTHKKWPQSTVRPTEITPGPTNVSLSHKKYQNLWF